MALVYVIVMVTAFLFACSFAVDYGRMRVARTQLQQAADAAAMYCVGGLPTISTTQNRAITSAADNKVEGTAVTITTADIEFGTWDPPSRSFTVLSGTARAGATAVRVTTRYVVPTVFTAAFGRSTINIQASATASIGKIKSASVDADMCPWLAGMSNGSYVAKENGNTQNSVAPAQSPYQVTGMDLTPGSKLYFRLTSGTTGWDNNSNGTFGPDGDTSWIVNQSMANKINSTQAPIGSLVGIFLDGRSPSSYSQATAGDYSTSSSRNFTNLSPPLKQVFFIGDGLDNAGALQSFTIPTGATRMYIGIMDENGWWWDNTGSLTTTVMDNDVSLVK